MIHAHEPPKPSLPELDVVFRGSTLKFYTILRWIMTQLPTVESFVHLSAFERFSGVPGFCGKQAVSLLLCFGYVYHVTSAGSLGGQLKCDNLSINMDTAGPPKIGKKVRKCKKKYASVESCFNDCSTCVQSRGLTPKNGERFCAFVR